MIRQHTAARRLLLTLLLTAAAMAAAQTMTKEEVEAHKVSVGSYRLFLNCTGSGPGPTVVLIASGDAGQWSKVQPEVSKFARVCSYDRMGTGWSDRTIPPDQTARETAADLHTLLTNAGEKVPYLLVGHSIGGIYARLFTEQDPKSVAGLVFVDSADEEQVWRFERISRALMFEYWGWPDRGKMAALGFLPQGGLLQWHYDLPLIVLEHGKTWPRGTFKGMTEEQYAELNRTWDAMQRDLASRSKYGQLRVAAESGHYIQTDQPEQVIKAISDVLDQARRRGAMEAGGDRDR